MIIYQDWELIDYQTAWDKQKALFESVIQHKLDNRKLPETEQTPPKHYLVLCEHPHVYTLGRNGDEKHLLADEQTLQQINAQYIKINRGGDITYHGLGQIVGYPIIDLDDFFTDIGRYVRSLEEVMIRVLADYGIVGGRISGLSGVWLEGETPQARKICAIGVHLSRWVTMHGFAFNINTDLNYFKHIVPCGIEDKGVTSLQQELGRKVDLEEVKSKIQYYFAQVFETTIV